jgi:3-phenylpropionate/trans-cinnamate dioxygenase ferredoxin component
MTERDVSGGSAGAGAAAGSGASQPPDPVGVRFEAVADVRDVPEGALVGVKNGAGEEICLYNLRGRIGAVCNVCTHAEFLLSDGVLRDDGTIECVWHGARFACASGDVRRGPAVDPLPVYEVRVDGDTVLVGPRKTA